MREALESTRGDMAITAFEQLFLKRGPPSAIRSDNGMPFASPKRPSRAQARDANAGSDPAAWREQTVPTGALR
jgi:hypothetical protein